MRPVPWGRLITAMVTPFDRDLNVDYVRAEKLARMLVSTGSDAVLVTGTTGESPTLQPAERVRLLETVLQAVGDSSTVIAGTGTYSTSDSIELTREAERAGAHGIMLVTPYYNKPPQAGMIDHFTRIAGETALPVLLYNVPSRTGANMLPKTVERLAAVPNIVAVKEASGSTDQVTEVLRRVPEGFRVYSGDDSMTLPIMSLGGYGIVSVASHVAGLQIKRMLELYVAGDTAGAATAHRDLFPLFKALFITANPIPVKVALRLLGMDVGPTRPPLSAMTAEESSILTQAMQALGILA
jgi:4-hydroxy-tetrahydrodipicolinate synthase